MRITRWCCYHKVDNFYTNLKNCLLEVAVVGDGGGSTPNSFAYYSWHWSLVSFFIPIFFVKSMRRIRKDFKWTPNSVNYKHDFTSLFHLKVQHGNTRLNIKYSHLPKPALYFRILTFAGTGHVRDKYAHNLQGNTPK